MTTPQIRPATAMLGLALLIAAAPACRGSRIVDPATPSEATVQHRASVVLGDFEREPDILPDAYRTFFGSMARSMREEFARAQMFSDVTHARDLGTEEAAPGTLYVTTRLVDFTATSKANPGMLVNLLFCSFTVVPCFWHGQIAVANQTIASNFEVAVYDVSGRTPQQFSDPRSGARMNSFVTNGLTPLFRDEFPITLRVKKGYEKEPDAIVAFAREMARDVVFQILNEEIVAFASMKVPAPKATEPATVAER